MGWHGKGIRGQLLCSCTGEMQSQRGKGKATEDSLCVAVSAEVAGVWGKGKERERSLLHVWLDQRCMVGKGKERRWS